MQVVKSLQFEKELPYKEETRSNLYKLHLNVLTELTSLTSSGKLFQQAGWKRDLFALSEANVIDELPLMDFVGW